MSPDAPALALESWQARMGDGDSLAFSAPDDLHLAMDAFALNAESLFKRSLQGGQRSLSFARLAGGSGDAAWNTKGRV